MKKSNDTKVLKAEEEKSGISCGNCWGHQEYLENYVDKTIDIRREKNENFISKFVNKYLRK